MILYEQALHDARKEKLPFKRTKISSTTRLREEQLYWERGRQEKTQTMGER